MEASARLNEVQSMSCSSRMAPVMNRHIITGSVHLAQTHF